MFKEILQIIPQLSATDLNKMEKTLGSRFGNIAKKFGKGLLGALAGGGIAGIALGLVDKLLNPLKEVQDAIEKTLNKGSDLAVQAKQFNTSAGELAKLQAFGQAKGLEPEQINLLIEKFQSAVSEAALDPTKHSAVRNFVGEKDTAQAFLTFIENLQALDKQDKNKAIQVQQEVFGEKQILRMSEFLNADFNKLNAAFKGLSTEKLTKSINTLEGIDEKSKTFAAVRGLGDLNSKASALAKNNVAELNNAQEQRKLKLENEQIGKFDQLQSIEAASTEILNTVKSGMLTLTSLLVKVTNLTENVKKAVDSPLMRGIKHFFGGKGE